MCYPICGIMLMKEALLLIGKNSSGFPLSLSELSFTIFSFLFQLFLCPADKAGLANGGYAMQ